MSTVCAAPSAPAMEDGEVVDIAVQIGTGAGTPPKNVTVTVNGAALSMFLIVSLP